MAIILPSWQTIVLLMFTTDLLQKTYIFLNRAERHTEMSVDLSKSSSVSVTEYPRKECSLCRGVVAWPTTP